jgi:hypothetical protein
MMKMIKSSSLFYVVLTLFFVSYDLQAQGEIEWSKTYGGVELEEARCVQQTSDGGFIFTGRTRSYGEGKESVWLVKTNASGDTLWTRTYGGDAKDRGMSVQQTTDGGYVIAARTESFSVGEWDYWLIKTDANGDTMWTRTYGGIAKDGVECVRQTADGGYILAGNTASFGAGNSDAWIIKINASGETMWTKTYGGQYDDSADFVQQTDDGGYIIAGNTQSFGNGSEENSDVWLIKTDASGDTLWTKTYGDSLIDFCRYVDQTSDGGYILTGFTDSPGFNNIDCFLIKTNSTGDTIWTKIYGGPGEDQGRCVQQTDDGGYIIAAWYSSQVAVGDDNIWLDYWILKCDADGDTMWTRTYDGGEMDEVYYIQQTNDKGYIVAGFADKPGDASSDIWLLKLYPDPPAGNISDDLESLPSDFELSQNFPNPFNPTTVINYELPITNYVELTIYNSLGQIIVTLVSGKQAAGVHQVKWDASGYASGVYHYMLKVNGFQDVKKMILLR